MRILTVMLFLTVFCLPGIGAAQSTRCDPTDQSCLTQNLIEHLQQERAKRQQLVAPRPFQPAPQPSPYYQQPSVDLNQQGYDLLMQQYLQRQQLEHNHRLQRGGQ